MIPIEEGLKFYDLSHVVIPETRPYAWSMSVSSLDAITSFQETGAQGPKEISLGHIKGSGSLSDFRLLNIGWMVKTKLFFKNISSYQNSIFEKKKKRWLMLF